MSCFLWHDWDKWVQYKWTGRVYYPGHSEKEYPAEELRQRRQCKRCGKAQEEII